MIKILIVEDDKLLGREMSLALTEGGYEVTWVKSSDEALMALGKVTYTLIFLDIMLPGSLDGYGLLSHIKASVQNKAAQVVMLSNLSQMAEIDRAMELGASDYVVKANIDLEKLVELVETKFLR